ncbi:MAG: hypothetical protein A2X13_03785 [Bacteroidetes bacterium GWC2_33_15]|nr:MAG: hypothetical protein A2X10_02455 [Bacteroidetes bacterium GWA2_33_15]OFX49646.1 MAG: hypothetical protein A2X13_03785 [Bacteroidetes bacterium GWC2_33_15]OFX65964.1 MAG: hypothetical protein A2X15_11050 [Bacteroidetes bacterium GWB2_32_14]OFX68275.1 MAG: hypothetical protein A2X14_07845 [Bacteroidetes bacterium GWD2_33_33]HAN18056.1 hypothetical protein [Bacteroidales bacterium]
MENVYQDQVYQFKGLWDVPSICGLKIIKKLKNTIVIATDLFDENPGTSITEWNTKLAKDICDKNQIDYKQLIYIEHTPDKKTKLSFNHESFFKVNFEIRDDKFVNPQWSEITKDEVNNLMNE